jgi:hypothetical protein
MFESSEAYKIGSWPVLVPTAGKLDRRECQLMEKNFNTVSEMGTDD